MLSDRTDLLSKVEVTSMCIVFGVTDDDSPVKKYSTSKRIRMLGIYLR